MAVPVAEIFTNSSDWLPRVCRLQPLDVVTVHPRDGLTMPMVIDAMKVQGLFKMRPGFRIVDHGTKIFIQREKE